MPRGPNRTAAHKRNGSGAYSAIGRLVPRPLGLRRTSHPTASSAACHQWREKVAQKQMSPTATPAANRACERASHAADEP